MKITRDVRDCAAALSDPNLMSMALSAPIEDGVAAMSEKFKARGEQVYVNAARVKESNGVL